MSISATLVPSIPFDDEVTRRLDELERQMSRLHAALTQKNREIEMIRSENVRLKSQLQSGSLNKLDAKTKLEVKPSLEVKTSLEVKPWQQRPAPHAGLLTQEEFELALKLGRDPVRVRHFKRAS